MSKRINLALLLDANKKQNTDHQPPKTYTSQQNKSIYVEKRLPQMREKNSEALNVIKENHAYSALCTPCFPLTDISNLNNIPAFYSHEQVEKFCEIPQLLADIRPSTLLKCNSRADLFPGITFLEKPHEYWLSEEIYNRLCGLPPPENFEKWNHHRFRGSVTNMAGKCFAPFDSSASINAVLGSQNYNSPDYEYFQMTPQQISCQYLLGNKLGTLLHYLIELFFNGYYSCIPPQLKDRAWSQFELFYVTEIRNKYKAFLTEMRVYDFEHDLAGSIDGVFVQVAEWEASQRESRPPVLTLFDWKRTKHFHEKSFRGEMAMAPLQHLPDANLHKYFCQVNIYKKIIERNSNYKVGSMFLVRFHPSSPSYELKKIPFLEKETNDLFALRKAEIELANATK